MNNPVSEQVFPNSAKMKIQLMSQPDSHTLYDSLVFSMLIAAELDHSNGYIGLQNATIVPETLIWAVGQRHPQLNEQLQTVGLVDELRALLAQYGSLRDVAERLRKENFFATCEAYGHYDDDNGYLTPSDIVFAIDSGEWNCPSATAFGLIQRAAHAVAAQFSDDAPMLERYIDTSWKPSLDANSIALKLIATCQPGSGALPEEALVHMYRQLVACDDGLHTGFWFTVYLSVVGDWLEQDFPDLAAQIVKDGLSTAYYYALNAYRDIMSSVEVQWEKISYPVRSLLLQSKDESDILRVLEKFIKASSKSTHDEAALAVLLWEMIKRRSCAVEPTAVYTFNASSDCIEAIRLTDSNDTTCFVVDSEALPPELRSKTDERQVLVVPVSAYWLENREELTQTDGLSCYYRKYDSEERSIRSLAINRAFCCNHDSLWPLMFAWRRQFPVIYTFKKQCVLVNHRFNHFIDLRSIADTSGRHTPSIQLHATKNYGVVTKQYCSSSKAYKEEPLSIFTGVADLRTTRSTQTLNDTYVAHYREKAKDCRRRDSTRESQSSIEILS
ncbi:hypothetical protein [Burkholderia sp. Ax-1719]|uniref:hypothetical protein n=1 Tax=Burkholderia sp. Ax-1719 TaxID=2608334 RepID=UPI001422271B|nr:hypothetical protein [Burkholderia sp. Ax-1719]NIE63221.1 hypothetical protein [Burkholderia sp. Ax-1719]